MAEVNYYGDIDYKRKYIQQVIARKILIARLAKADAAIQAREGLASAIADFSGRMNQRVGTGRDLEDLHGYLAENARTQIVLAYQNSGLGRRPSYRWADTGRMRRYSNKALLNALRSPEFISGSKTGIVFVNTGFLDKQAKQWYRLNFGARPKGARRVDEGSMALFGRRLDTRFTVRTNGLGEPSSEFYVPETLIRGAFGVFSSTFAASSTSQAIFGTRAKKLKTRAKRGSAGQGDAFYVWFPKIARRAQSKNPRFASTSEAMRKRGRTRSTPPTEFRVLRKKSRGIYGASFLESGSKYLNDQYPKRLRFLIDEWIDLARDSLDRRIVPRGGVDWNKLRRF